MCLALGTICLLMLDDQHFYCLLKGYTLSYYIYIFRNGTTINNLQEVPNYLLILGSICGIIGEKAIANKMDICHSCLTYFGVTSVGHFLAWKISFL